MSLLVAMVLAVMAAQEPRMTPELKRALEEYSRRQSVRDGILGSLYTKQRAAAESRAKRQVWEGTRRCGKTWGFLASCVHTALREPNTDYAYIALTSPSAEGIAWPILRDIDRRHGLQMRFQEVKLRATLPTGSTIQLIGADRPGFMYRLYGRKFRRVGIDEAAFFSTSLQDLVEDVLDATLSDLEGELVMMSIPGFVRRGYFWDAASGAKPGWEKHKLTALDNPFMARQFQQRIDELMADDPDVVNTPSFRRNYLGEWVYDIKDLAYHFDPERNSLDAYDRHDEDQYILGLDIGYTDNTAFSLCSWSEKRPEFYELESFVKKKMLLDEVAAHLRAYRDAYPELLIVADPARKQLIEELQQRFDVDLFLADKTDKNDWVDLVNTDYAQGKIKIFAPENSPHVEEMSELRWKVYPNGKRIEAPGATNDACDAFLYAYRHAHHYRYRAVAAKPMIGTREYWNQVAKDTEDKLVAEYEAKSSKPWWSR